MMRILLALAASILCAVASAATVSERSPISQGLWWDPTRSGHGFEIFNANGELSVFWYTYDDSGAPIWYTAQGAVADAGSPYPLLRHRWKDGHKDGYDTIGTLTLSIANSESATVAFTLPGNQSGTWKIEPFRVWGVVNEVDHDGVWFDASNPGWGLSVLDQGDVLGGALYFYTPEGRPSWVAGFTHGGVPVQYFSYAGTCPACAYRAPGAMPAGTVAFSFSAEDRATITARTTVPVADGLRIDGARIVQLGRPASARPADRQLARFDKPSALKALLDAGLANLPPTSSGADFSAAPSVATVSFSSTNLQEQGVDEADLVKTDGHYVYTYAHGVQSGDREPVLQVASLAADGSGIAAGGRIPLAVGDAASVKWAGLVLAGKRLASVTGTQPPPAQTLSAWVVSQVWAGGRTQVEILDTTSGEAPKTLWNAVLDGHPIATRRIGDRLYVVTRFVPNIPGFVFGCRPACNGALLAATPLEKMLPTVSVNGGVPVPLAPSDVLSPPQGAALPSAEITTVTAFDLANPSVVQRLAVVGATEAIYVSPANLYVATTRSLLRNTVGGIIVQSAATYTDIHQIALGATLSYVGSGTLEGFLGTNLDKTPFRLSESGGKLRVVTSFLQDGGWGIQSNRNQLTTLEPSAFNFGFLKTVSMLPNPQRPAVLGKAFEELYATRFVGDKLYAVTFTSRAFSTQVPFVDPLYVVDLANPADPRIRGSLEIPGYSDYLHPLANGQLLGFGRVVTSTGVEQGLQLSLFDVSDPDNPRALQQVALGLDGSDSALLKSHHALSVMDRGADGIDIAFPARLLYGPAISAAGSAPTYAWQESSLFRYRVRDGRLLEGIGLPVFPKSGSAPLARADHTATTGRSILLGNGAAAYIGNGRFWFQDAAGLASGPFN